MIPYQPQIRPFRQPTVDDPRKCVGDSCPVCDRSLLVLPIAEIKDDPDGSATFDCPICRAKLRMNPEAFVFLDTRT